MVYSWLSIFSFCTRSTTAILTATFVVGAGRHTHTHIVIIAINASIVGPRNIKSAVASFQEIHIF